MDIENKTKEEIKIALESKMKMLTEHKEKTIKHCNKYNHV